VKLLVVDLLAERISFGEKGVEEIIRHFPGHEVILWAPHTDEAREYSFGRRVEKPEKADSIVITGSRKNVSMWEAWMDEVADLITKCEVPLYGICFGHQIICKALGGEVARAETGFHQYAMITDRAGNKYNQLFTHQDHVIDSGEMEVVASAEHCEIAACKHPTRPIYTVQFHPEAVQSLLDYSVKCGDMTVQERLEFGDNVQDLDVTSSLIDSSIM
jgi:GMP synthase-like glutamine amidotransferase